MEHLSGLIPNASLDVIGNDEDKGDFQKFLKDNHVSFNYVIKETVDPINPLTLGLLTGLTPTLVRILYDYVQSRRDKGFRLRVHTGQGVVDISARTTPKDLDVIIREKLKK